MSTVFVYVPVFSEPFHMEGKNKPICAGCGLEIDYTETIVTCDTCTVDYHLPCLETRSGGLNDRAVYGGQIIIFVKSCDVCPWDECM